MQKQINAKQRNATAGKCIKSAEARCATVRHAKAKCVESSGSCWGNYHARGSDFLLMEGGRSRYRPRPRTLGWVLPGPKVLPDRLPGRGLGLRLGLGLGRGLSLGLGLGPGLGLGLSRRPQFHRTYAHGTLSVLSTVPE